jgi:hypothetical protein
MAAAAKCYKKKEGEDTKVQVNIEQAMRCAFPTLQISGSYRLAVDTIKSHVKSHAVADGMDSPSADAFKNCSGAWFEYMVEADAWNILRKTNPDFVCFSIPNKAQFDFIDLFDDEARALLTSLRESLKTDGVSLVSANPDLLIIRDIQLPPQLDKDISIEDLMGNDSFSSKVLASVKGKVKWHQLHAAISLKLSLSPDRVFQVVHEANSLKATYEHLRTRLWNRNVAVGYYFWSPEVTNPSKEVLRTVATHSILNVANQPESAVNDVMIVDSYEDLKAALVAIT